MNFHQILQKPIITEKTASLEEEGRYVFKVGKTSDKGKIKRVFKELYGITPIKVAIVQVKAKSNQKRVKRKAYKKAIITLPEGKTIDLLKIKK